MVVFLDIETRMLAEEVGGWAELKRGAGGISVAVTLEEPSKEVRIWDDHTLPELAEYLESADTVVHFNGLRFDIPIITNVLGRPLLLKNQVDVKQLVGGISLEAAGHKYVGRGKTGSGTDAPRLLREGRIAQLVQYCLDDVTLTRDIYLVTGGNSALDLPPGCMV